MENQTLIQRVKLYAWIGLAYCLLWILVAIGSQEGHIAERVVNTFWFEIFTTTVNFFFFEYMLPFIFRKRAYFIINILLFAVIFSLVMLVFAFGFYFWRNAGIRMHIYTSLREFKTVKELIVYHMPHGFLSIFFFALIRHMVHYTRLQAMSKQLQLEKKEAELNFLRSQTNPHFLFNTLNNIYSLARDKSDLAPESVLRLSQILRYMLYETSGEYIAIEQEIRIMQDYISLEKLRYDENLRVNFEQDIEDMKQALPPLLMIPLVENAFKHGVSETTLKPYVDIQLSVKNRQLLLEVKNSTGTSAAEESVKENIGLTNLRRQLELLYKVYTLVVGQENGRFTSTLKINLASHV
jgi:sensor histidine kinase YesM